MWMKDSGIREKVFRDIRLNGGDERFRDFLKPTVKGCLEFLAKAKILNTF